MDSFLEEYIPLPAHDTTQVQMLACSSKQEASGVSHPDLYGRCWIFIDEDTVPVGAFLHATSSFILYRFFALRMLSSNTLSTITQYTHRGAKCWTRRAPMPGSLLRNFSQNAKLTANTLQQKKDSIMA